MQVNNMVKNASEEVQEPNIERQPIEVVPLETRPTEKRGL